MALRSLAPRAFVPRVFASLLLCACLVLTLPACDSGDDDDGNGGLGDLGAGITALVDGSRWTATFISAAGRDEQDQSFGLGGTDGMGNSIVLAVNALSTGTYSTGNTVFVASYSMTSQTGGTTYTTALGGSGTITVTSLTADRVAGTFSFTASNGTQTVSVTDGEFDVAFVDN